MKITARTWRLSLALLFYSLSAHSEIQTTACTAPTTSALYIATSGSDSNDGSLGKPFKTLTKAIANSRTRNIKNIFLRAGTYWLTSTVDINASDKGLRIANYPCEKVILDGGQALSSWRSEGNGIYSTAVTSPVNALEFIVANQRQRAATAGVFDAANPFTSGYHFIEGLKGGNSQQIYFNKSTLRQSDLPSLEGILLQSYAWDRQNEYNSAITSIDWSQGFITLASKPGADVGEGTFRLFNNPKWLRNNGEFTWSWKTSEKRLYTKQASLEFSKTAVIPKLTTLLSIHDTDDVRVTGLVFQNVTAEGQAIKLSKTSAVYIGGNTFRNVGRAVYGTYAIWSRIGGNTIDSTGYHGIEFYLGCDNNRIYNNSIRNVGQVRKHTAGIMGAGVDNSYIAYNNIENTSRYGISIKTWNAVTENLNNIIANNYVSNACLETGDCGAIETLGRTAVLSGNIIRNNWVEKYNGLGSNGESFVEGFKGFGIYLDDLSSGTTVSGNFLKNLGNGLAHVYIHGGDHNDILNNFGISDHTNMRFLRLENVPLAGTLGVPHHNEVYRNVIYYKNRVSKYTWYGTGGTVKVDRNLIFNTGRYFENNSLQDANSLLMDPLFVDVESNWHLRSDSPALKLGIEDLQFERMGMRGYSNSDFLPKFW